MNGYGKGGVNMGSSESIGLFMDFIIYKSFETTEDNILAPVFTGKIFNGVIQFQCNTLDELIIRIVKYEYLNNPYYECLLYNLTKDIKKEKEGV